MADLSVKKTADEKNPYQIQDEIGSVYGKYESQEDAKRALKDWKAYYGDDN